MYGYRLRYEQANGVLDIRVMATKRYTLAEIKLGDKHLEQEFIALPKRLYKDNPNWVCPFDSSIKAVFDPKKNKLFNDGEAIRWVAYNAEGE